MVIRKVAVVLSLCLLTGCQQMIEQTIALEFKFSGSKVPRNPQEEVIFDYLQALKEEKYDEAYRLRMGSGTDSSVTIELFRERHIANRSSLATEISIGKKRKGNPEDECAYVFTVYAFSPGATVRTSGMVATGSEPDNPGVCLITYNSAFGSVP